MTSAAPRRPDRLAPALAALLLVALVVPGLPAAAAGVFMEKSVAVPRDTKVPVEIAYEKATILWVESQNDPKDKDVAEAEKIDPDDKTIVVLRFTYKNEDYYGHKVKLRVILLDDKGAVLAEGGRSATLDKGEPEDTVSFPIKVRTLDWPKAATLHVTATFGK